MKTLAVVLVLALAFSFGKALRCYKQYNIYGAGFTTVVTCKGPRVMCAEVLLTPPYPNRKSSFRNCMEWTECQRLGLKPKLWTARCCGTDLCN